ncbi:MULTISPECIES: MurR/RpiR family transcriptional regulator [Paenibacillus]|uniref:MurR/RpiR family transcriptional regulator n=1 Tax=Paenibacillus residui TaxID=629724 RepID=A0ABW3DF38_9BACL|nr:MurR/RpiR family transcriptional regulator [Paenibacillus sp. 32O-W]
MRFEQKVEAAFDALSPGMKKIAYFAAKEMKQAAITPARKLGKLAGVSEATVHRFARQLGYGSFSAMQSDLQAQVLEVRPVQRLLQSAEADYAASWLEEHFRLECDNLQATAELKQEDRIEAAAKLLIRANRIAIAGWRAGLAVTSPLSYILRYMLGEGELIPQGECAEFAARLTAGDVLFVCGFPRYCGRTMKVSEAAREAGVPLIALTDSPLSPFARLADVVLLAATRSGGFLDSYIAPLAVVNALVQRIARLDKERVALNLLRTETHFRGFDSQFIWPTGSKEGE